jgi:hypothetical protein
MQAPAFCKCFFAVPFRELMLVKMGLYVLASQFTAPYAVSLAAAVKVESAALGGVSVR